MKKTCFKCNLSLPIEEFYEHPKMKDGRLGKCKSCTRKGVAERVERLSKNPRWAKAEAERQRRKGRVDNVTRPEVHRARRAVRQLGRSKEFHWHHWSYREEDKLDVIQMMPKEHRRAHRYLIFDPEHLMYRRTDNLELLDTRTRHEAYLKKLAKKPF